MLLQYSKLNRYLDDVNKRLLTMLNLFNFSILRNLNEYLNKHNSSNSYFSKRWSCFFYRRGFSHQFL